MGAKSTSVKKSAVKKSTAKKSTPKKSTPKKSAAKNTTAKAPGQKAAPRKRVTVGKENHPPATVTPGPASASAPISARRPRAQPLVCAPDEGMPVCYYHS